MKKLRLLLLGLLTPLLCGVSFGVAPEFILDIDPNNVSNYLNGTDTIYLRDVLTQNQIDQFLQYSQVTESPICLSYAGNGYSRFEANLGFQNYYGYINGNYSFYMNNGSPFSDVVCFNGNYFSSSSFRLSVPYGDSNTFLHLRVYVPESTDCSTFENDLNTCTSSYNSLKSDYNTLSGSYNTCQSNLSSCQNNGSNCDTLYGVCVENLSGCNSDKESLTNYNEALSTQLNECLNNQSTGSNLSGLILNNNSLFRYLDDSLLSLPINNNLFLPLGYQGALDSGNVLYIKAIDEQEPISYYVAEEDKISIIDILSYLFIFLLGIGVIFSLIKLFRKLFTH